VWRKLLHEHWNPDNGKEATKSHGGSRSAANAFPYKQNGVINDLEITIKTESPGDWDGDDEDLEEALQLAKAIR
jgi:hypothetical protein